MALYASIHFLSLNLLECLIQYSIRSSVMSGLYFLLCIQCLEPIKGIEKGLSYRFYSFRQTKLLHSFTSLRSVRYSTLLSTSIFILFSLSFEGENLGQGNITLIKFNLRTLARKGVLARIYLWKKLSNSLCVYVKLPLPS